MKNTRTSVTLWLDGTACTVAAGTTVAAALVQGAISGTRRSVAGEIRAPFCGMGICHECRVDIDGRRRLACQVLCAEGMQVHTGLPRGEAGPLRLPPPVPKEAR